MTRELREDRRIGGRVRYVICDEFELMQVPPEIRKCVCYIRGTRRAVDNVGTASFVGVSLGVDNRDAVYVVTSKHCVLPNDFQTEGLFDSIHLRLNTHVGGADEIEVPFDAWYMHPDSDVAVVPLAPDRKVFDYLYFPTYACAHESFLRQFRIGPGEEVLITGLFVYHPGDSRILPILRVGNIAGFTEEPIALKTGDTENVILVEARSLGGLSGSPVWLHLDDFRRDEVGNLTVAGGEWNPPGATSAGLNYLMGVMHGLWNTTDDDPDTVIAGVNAGISVVIPIDRVLEIINSQEFEDMRDETRKDIQKRRSPTTASSVGRQADSPEFAQFKELTGRLFQVSKDEADQVHRGHQP